MEDAAERCLFQEALGSPCRQERNMAAMEMAVSTIADAVKEIKDGQKELTIVIREIAVQGEKMVNIEQRLDEEVKDRKHVNEILFGRVRDLEQAPVIDSRTRWNGVFVAIAACFLGLFAAWVKSR